MDPRLLKRTDMDFLRRSLPGVFIYALAWPILVIFSDLGQQEPLLGYGFALLFVLISVLRLGHAALTQVIYLRTPRAWRQSLFMLVLAHGACLSFLFVVMILESSLHHLTLATGLIVIGIISGAAPALSPKLKFCQLYVATLVVPPMIASLFSPSFLFLAPLMFCIWLYLVFTGRRFHFEYQRAFHTERKLKANQTKLELLSQTDPLTGIHNRQFFDHNLALQWDLASRSQANLSLLFLDLDHFKKINDEHGHLVGDQALIHAAHIFKDMAKRKSDMVARYGGEEFAIILPSTHHQDAIALAHNIRKSLQTQPYRHGEVAIPLTVSIGINSLTPNPKVSAMAFLHQADQALYQAKALGRNRVVSYLETVCPLERPEQDLGQLNRSS